MEAIYENYSAFLNEHSNEFSSAQGMMRLITDPGMFRAYKQTLTDGIESERAVAACNAVLDRQQTMLLTEAAQGGGPSPVVSGWTVMSFPILVDIYSEPIVSEICNIYAIDKPMISIPRVRIKSQTTSYDGNTIQESYIPTATKLIRAGIMDVDIAPNAMSNVFTSTTLDKKKMKMNRRYTLLTSLTVVEYDAGMAVVGNHEVPVNIRPDGRAQLNAKFNFDDTAGETVTGNVIGHVEYKDGNIQFQVVFEGGTAGNTYECAHGTFSLRFVPVGTMSGRTKVVVEHEMTDITVDPNEDFLIDLTEED